MKIIALEGPDRLGKSTQALKLSEALNAEYVKFPNEKLYSGQIIRKIINKEMPFEPASFQALQIINRLETFELLEQEKTYVFDRYKLSGVVYGLADGLPEDWIRKVCDLLPDPNVTFIFSGVPFELDSDIYSDPKYQEKIYDFYWQEAKNITGKKFWISNIGSIEYTHNVIWEYLKGVDI